MGVVLSCEYDMKRKYKNQLDVLIFHMKILNGKDFCINIAGPKENNGCPMPIIDTDEDGVADEDDFCPKVPAKTGRYYGTIGLGCPEKPKDIIFIKPEIPAKYKGNWEEFVAKNLEYPVEYQDICVEGRVIVKFIVDKMGQFSDIKAVSGPLELRKEAERVVRLSSGNWEPAIDKGEQGASYCSAIVTFQLK